MTTLTTCSLSGRLARFGTRRRQTTASVSLPRRTRPKPYESVDRAYEFIKVVRCGEARVREGGEVMLSGLERSGARRQRLERASVGATSLALRTF